MPEIPMVQNPPSRWDETGVLQGQNNLDDWIAIEPDGTVTVKSGKVELGTGVQTALAQIVAEELDVPFDRIRMVMGDTRLTPDEGYTAGSKTIKMGGNILRKVAAEARQAMLEKASDRLDATVEELVVRDGIVAVEHHPDRTTTYAELMGGQRFYRQVTGSAKIKPASEYRLVGTPVPRVDIPGKSTGAPSYVQDLRLPGMLHGRMVRPPAPGSRLKTLDQDSIKSLPGIVNILHTGNYVGIIAEREEQAVRAAKELKVGWETGTPFPAMDDLYEYIRHEAATDEVDLEEGEVDAALERAAIRVQATYFQPYQAHASIGPSCAVADFGADEVTVWSSTQGVYPLRGALADLLQMPLEKVHVIHVEGAGSYGHNGSDDVAADAALLSRAVGRPVRVQWSREEEFAWEPYVPAMVMRAGGGLDVQGNVIAWDYHVWTPTHANRARRGAQLLAAQLMSGQPAPPSPFFLGGNRNAPTNYAFPNNRVTMHWLARSPLRTSSYRSLGAAANTFANESFMDELAAAARVDPVEFRLRHLRDPRAAEVLRAAAQGAGWDTTLARGGGRGIAFACYENEEAYVATVAHVEVNRETGEVRVRRVVVAHDCGLIVNPDGLRNQIEGNVVQSTSRALKEQVTFDPEHITSVDWDSYPILKFSEVPDVEVILLNRPDQPSQGAGEPATITTAAAIANAIYDATGARIRQVPFRPKQVLAALGQRP